MTRQSWAKHDAKSGTGTIVISVSTLQTGRRMQIKLFVEANDQRSDGRDCGADVCSGAFRSCPYVCRNVVEGGIIDGGKMVETWNAG